jgi:hypothetical protein
VSHKTDGADTAVHPALEETHKSKTRDTETSICISRPAALGESLTHAEFEHVTSDLPHGTFARCRVVIPMVNRRSSCTDSRTIRRPRPLRFEGGSSLASARTSAFAPYKGGMSSLLDVLDADRRLLENRDAEIQTKSSAARAAVVSFHTLGGGWDAPEELSGGASARDMAAMRSPSAPVPSARSKTAG